MFGSGEKQYSAHYENRKIGSFYSGIVLIRWPIAEMVANQCDDFNCKKDTSVLTSGNISVRDALRTKGDEAKRVILKELQQMLTLRVMKEKHLNY